MSAEPVLTMTYDDQAAPFDPTYWRPEADMTASSPERQEGLAGIALLFGLSSTVEYHPRPDGNRLVMTFAARA